MARRPYGWVFSRRWRLNHRDTFAVIDGVSQRTGRDTT